ncbi:MAG: ATP-binding protein, partial [Thermomicrobiales bacterium]
MTTSIRLVPLGDHPLIIDELPTPLTSFVGRERQVADLCALLQADNVRLVTLTGPGGIGKTRLALRAAELLRDDPALDSEPAVPSARHPEESRDRRAGNRGIEGRGHAFPDGVAFVELAPIRDPDLVLPIVAQVLGIRESNERSVVERLAAAMRSRRLLLVLDNLEQVLGAAPAVAELLSACPGLTILATSRTLLRVSGEHDVPVLPLSLPDQVGDEASDALHLFAARAQAIMSDFALDHRTTPVAAAICRRLDGLPLAIELAASRLRHLPPEGLLLRLDHRLSLLTGGARDQPPRLQSMRDAVTWSYDLLTPDEQSLFRRLAVFAGGFSLDAAEQVTAEGGRRKAGSDDGSSAFRLATPPPSASVLDGIAALVDHSLLRPIATSRDEDAASPRFGMLETVREYALEQLAASGEAAPARTCHAAWALAFAERAESALTGPDQNRWLARVERDYPNLRAALDWLTEHGPCEHALRLVTAICRFCEVRGYWSEGRRRLEDLLASANASPEMTLARARAFTSLGRLTLLQEDEKKALAYHARSLALYRAAGDRQGIAFALANIGFLAHRRGNARRAEILFDESLAISRTLGHRHGSAFALDSLGVIANLRGEQERASDLFAESLALSRETSDQWQIAVTLANLGIVTTHQADYARAGRLFEESLPLSLAAGNNHLAAIALSYLGLIAQERGEPDRAVTLFVEALARCRDREGHPPGPRCLAGLAIALQRWGYLERAARLHGATDAIRTAVVSTMWPAERAINERYIAALKRQIGEKAFGIAWNAGRGMRLDEVVAEALAVASMQPEGGWREAETADQ